MVRMMMYPLIMIAAGSSVDLFKQTDRRRLDVQDDLMIHVNTIKTKATEMLNDAELKELFENSIKYFDDHKETHKHLYCLLFPEAKNDVLVKALQGDTEDLQFELPNQVHVVMKYILYANIVTYMGSFLTIPGFNWLLRLVFGKWFVLFFASNSLAIYYWYTAPKQDLNNNGEKDHRSLKYPAFVMSYVVVQIADTVTYMLGFGPLKWINNILSVGFQVYYFLNFMFITAFPVYASLHQVDEQGARVAPLIKWLRDLLYPKNDTEGTSDQNR